jgi:hypothetical protein
MTLHGNTSKIKNLFLSPPLSSMLSPSFSYNLRLFAIQFYISMYFLSFSQTQKSRCLSNPPVETFAYTNILTSWSKMHKNNPCFIIKDNKMTISQTAP